jgi:hypothetical protein
MRTTEHIGWYHNSPISFIKLVFHFYDDFVYRFQMRAFVIVLCLICKNVNDMNYFLQRPKVKRRVWSATRLQVSCGFSVARKAKTLTDFVTTLYSVYTSHRQRIRGRRRFFRTKHTWWAKSPWHKCWRQTHSQSCLSEFLANFWLTNTSKMCFICLRDDFVSKFVSKSVTILWWRKCTFNARLNRNRKSREKFRYHSKQKKKNFLLTIVYFPLFAVRKIISKLCGSAVFSTKDFLS